MSNYAADTINMNDVFMRLLKYYNSSYEPSQAANYSTSKNLETKFLKDNDSAWNDIIKSPSFTFSSNINSNNSKIFGWGSPVFGLKTALKEADFILNSSELSASSKVRKAIAQAKSDKNLEYIICDAIGDVRSSFNNGYLDFNEFGLYNYDIANQAFVEEETTTDNRYFHELIYNRLAWYCLYKELGWNTIRSNTGYSSSYVSTYYDSNNVNYNFLIPSSGWTGWNYIYSARIDNTDVAIYNRNSDQKSVEGVIKDWYESNTYNGY